MRMRIVSSVLVSAFMLLNALKASAASFDCAKAVTPVEKVICADPTLARLDVEIATAYAAAGAGLDDAMRARLHRSQREWLAHREAARKELTRSMQARRSLLRSPRRTLGGIAFLELTADSSRPMFMLAPMPGALAYNRWADTVWENDSGEYTIAEGDREQAKCEADAKPGERDGCVVEGDEHVFTTVVLPPGVVSVSEWLAQDQHAAHPIEERHHTNWWLLRSGRIGPGDMFKGNSYKDAIVRAVRGGVQKRCGDTLPSQAAIDSMLDPDAWGLSPDGMELAGDGDIFDCGRGAVDIQVPWGTLRPALRPEFSTAIGLR